MDNPPLRLGNYEPLLELASGGMATVFVARRLGAAGFEHICVIKRVHRYLLNNREFYDMFRDEARVASLVRHPNVVPVVDVVEEGGELFLVMDYIEGSALATLRKAANDAGKKLAPAIVSRVVCDALAGLHAAHEVVDVRGVKLDVVHRDVSPQNVLIGVDGSSRIIDFGVAKARNRLTETKSGSLKGKYSYMAPEQARGQEIDRRTDLFAMGVVLWEALTGDRLFRGENDLDTLRRIVEIPIPDPSSVEPDVPKAADAVVQKALARDPDERYATAAEFEDALARALPPAPYREVAAAVQDLCADRLRERREELREMLEGRVPPLARKDAQAREDSVSTGGESVPQLRDGHEGTAGKIAVLDATLTETAPAPRKPWALVAAGGALAVALGVVAVVAVTRTGAADTKADTKSASTTSASTGAPATTTAVAADDVAITVTADGPIKGVDAPGLRSVEIRGASARVVVARFSAPIAVDATLEGGKHASATVTPDGPRDVRVAPTASATATAPRPSAKTAPPPRTTATELQSNPYGNP